MRCLCLCRIGTPLIPAEDLADDITTAQKAEITQMKKMLGAN
ncbi:MULTISPECIES: hypothetical protein [Streptomyces]|nr:MULTISPECIES: hypothetical protein [Streptomyces]